jgi:hypothetical protein
MVMDVDPARIWLRCRARALAQGRSDVAGACEPQYGEAAGDEATAIEGSGASRGAFGAA